MQWKASDRVVTVGLNRRGNRVFQKLAKEIPAGKIGKVSVARAARISNMSPNGIGKLKPEQPPKDLNWDMWLGPRAFRPYQYNIAPYMFRWWSDYLKPDGELGCSLYGCHPMADGRNSSCCHYCPGR